MRMVERDGVLIRELTAADRPALRFMFGRLSERSRYQRFLSARRELTDPELDRLTRIDHWHREALLAWSPPPRAPIAVARYVRAASFDHAEIAITVADAWQRRGLGGELALALRERARRAGIRRVSATTLADNRAAIALVRRLGDTRVVRTESGVVELECALW